jgi:hypothetical protein
VPCFLDGAKEIEVSCFLDGAKEYIRASHQSLIVQRRQKCLVSLMVQRMALST